ncbi:MAG: GAF domain-containing protein, partial [Bacteroidia bacterium]|nr:GAF domain-containing protein [Bacteroidia bacterium]
MQHPRFFNYIVLLLFSVTATFSQVNYKFHKLGVESGLSQNVVTSMVEDKQGFLWFGTMSGLNKYDGYTFKSFHFNPRDTNSLAESWVTNLCCSKDGNIWVATRQGGLNRLDPGLNKITRFLHDHNRKNSISENIVTCVIQSANGKIWAGTTDGLNVFDGAKDDFTRFYKNEKDSNSLAENAITSLFEDANGNIWIGSNKNCITEYNPKQNKFTRHYYTESATLLIPNIIKSITAFTPETLMIGTNRGLRFFDLASGKFINALQNYNHADTVLRFDVSTICKGKDGKFWCGIRFSNYAFIFSCIDPATKSVGYIAPSLNNPESVSYETMNASLADRSGVIWIGFNGKGINYFNPVAPKFFHLTKNANYLNHLSSEYIYAIYEDTDGSVWIGTSDRGVNHYFPSSQKMEYFDKGIMENNWCSDIKPDVPGKLWMAFKTNQIDGGVILFDTKKGSYQTIDEIAGKENLLSSFTVRVLLNEKNVLWIGTADGGLDRFDKKTKSMTVYRHDKKNKNSISGDEVSDIFRDRQGNLWIGTRSGLNLMDEKNQSFTNYIYNPRDTTCISSNYVLGILQDKKNNLWISTSHGINLMNIAKGTFRLYSTDNGLPDNFVYGMLEDESGNFWISTNNGLSEFNPLKNSFRNFAVSDGLQSKEFNTHAWHKGKSGKMYFGGIGGLNIFHPDSIHDNTYIPPVVITSLSIFGKEQHLDSGIFAKKTITLKYSENFISFDFASLDYLYPEKNEFSCQLEGFDKDWIQLGHRHTISYSNLDPGEYTLHVKATNDDGLWNEVGTRLKIIIPPPFYKTNLFYFLCVLVVGSIVFLTYKSRVKNLLKTKKLLEEQVNERTSEIEKQKEEISASYKNISEISEIGRLITSSLNLESILNTVYEGVNRLMDGKFFGIAIYDEKNSTIEYQLFINSGKRLDNFVIPLDKEGSLAAWCVRNKKELITNNKKEIDEYVPAAPLLLSGDDDTESIIMLPLLIGKKCIGVITVQSFQQNAFTNFHLETIRSIASYAAIAIDNAQLVENLEEIVTDRTKEVVLQKEQVEKAFINTRILNHIGQQVTSTLDFEEIFLKLYESVNKLMDAQCFGIRIYYPERNAVEYSFEFENGIRNEAFDVAMTEDNNYTVWCIKHNKEIFINDNENEYFKYVEKILVPWGNMPASLIFCPLRAGNRVIGVITVQSFSKNVYTDYHLDILQTLASYTSIAWDNAQLYNKMENKVKERTS